jgi:protein-S-isoprenylcysteine O-methyltransferase Ste14
MTTLEAVSYTLVWVYLLSFLALTSMAQREAGRPVWLFGKGKEKQAIPALLFRFAFLGAGFWPAIRLLTGDIPAEDPIRSALNGVWIDALGLALVALGAGISILSQRHMGASWRIGAAEGETGAIVDDGPFALSRNPVFVGQMFLFIGLFLVFPSLVQGALTAALIVAVNLQVRIEERVLASSLGEPYLDYSRRVGRWIGTRRA